MLNLLYHSGILKSLCILFLITYPLCATCYPTESSIFNSSGTSIPLGIKPRSLTHNLLNLAVPPSLSPFLNQFCGRFNGRGPGRVDGAKACIAYLRARGTWNCHVTRDTTEMCGAEGIIKIIGMANPAKGETTSLCSDVADAAQYVLDHCSTCPQDSCLVEGMLNNSRSCLMLMWTLLGAAVANGNGDFLVMVTG